MCSLLLDVGYAARTFASTQPQNILKRYAQRTLPYVVSKALLF
jgi:hypothetical protein